MSSKQRLHQYLLDLDKKRVSNDDPKNQMLEQDIMSIVNKALAKVTEKDKRFQFTLNGSGSYYDGVKVGSPDEFDYVAEITTLQGQSVTFSPTDDPGFVQIKLSTQEQRRLWKDCLSDPEELLESNAKREMFHCFDGECNPFPTYTDKKNEYNEDCNTTLELFEEFDDPFDLYDHFDDSYSDSYISEEEEYISDDMILAPTKLQTKFKLLFDEVMSKIYLPTSWEHGGFQRPHYSGCRRHGPATMIMLVYHNQGEEIKISVDVTLGIPVPYPVNFKSDLNMNVFENVKYGSIMDDILKQAMEYGPSIHLIPLYAKMLVKTQRYSNKFSYRISCSSLEKYILNFWEDDAGPKKCFRILKVIRDKYFAEGIRKTHRIKKKSKRRECKNVGDSAKLGQARKDTRPRHVRPKKKSADRSENPHLVKNNIDKKHSEKLAKPEITATEYAARVYIAHQDWAQEMVRNEQIIKTDGVFNQETDTTVLDREESDDQNNRNTSRNKIVTVRFGSQSEESGIDVNSMSQSESDLEIGASGTGETDLHVSIVLADKFEECNFDAVSKQKATTSGVTWKTERMSMIGLINSKENDTTDLTEIDETIAKRTKEEAFKKFQSTRHQYQSDDIADMTCKPGSGEYYGPSTYMASIEIKSYILRLLGTKWDPKYWTDEKVCGYVEEFFKAYHTVLLKKTMIKNFFFDTIVCSPISEEQRLKALEKYNVLQKDFNDIMEGAVNSEA